MLKGFATQVAEQTSRLSHLAKKEIEKEEEANEKSDHKKQEEAQIVAVKAKAKAHAKNNVQPVPVQMNSGALSFAHHFPAVKGCTSHEYKQMDLPLPEPVYMPSFTFELTPGMGESMHQFIGKHFVTSPYYTKGRGGRPVDEHLAGLAAQLLPLNRDGVRLKESSERAEQNYPDQPAYFANAPTMNACGPEFGLGKSEVPMHWHPPSHASTFQAPVGNEAEPDKTKRREHRYAYIATHCCLLFRSECR